MVKGEVYVYSNENIGVPYDELDGDELEAKRDARNIAFKISECWDDLEDYLRECKDEGIELSIDDILKKMEELEDECY